jgi:hypothetical protein
VHSLSPSPSSLRRESRRPIALLLAALTLGGCMTWRPVTTPTRALLAGHSETVVRVRRHGGEKLVLLAPRITGDTLHGSLPHGSEDFGSWDVAIPLADVEAVEVALSVTGEVSLDSTDADLARVKKSAADAGIEAVALSNHGGRQLDGAPAPIDLVAAVADTVGDRTEIICDGGVRRGSDIVKAVALGARACMAGRAHFYALAAPDFVLGPSAPSNKRNVLGVVDAVGVPIGAEVIKHRSYGQKVQEIIGGRATHPVFGEKPDEVNQAIEQFLAGLG